MENSSNLDEVPAKLAKSESSGDCDRCVSLQGTGRLPWKQSDSLFRVCCLYWWYNTIHQTPAGSLLQEPLFVLPDDIFCLHTGDKCCNFSALTGRRTVTEAWPLSSLIFGIYVQFFFCSFLCQWKINIQPHKELFICCLSVLSKESCCFFSHLVSCWKSHRCPSGELQLLFQTI